MNIHKKVCLRFRAKHVLVLICWQIVGKRKIFSNTHGTKIFREIAENDKKAKNSCTLKRSIRVDIYKSNLPLEDWLILAERKCAKRIFRHAPQRAAIKFPIKVQLRRTFIPLPAPRRRGLECIHSRGGYRFRFPLGTGNVSKGDSVPLRKAVYCFTSSITKHSMISPSLISL